MPKLGDLIIVSLVGQYAGRFERKRSEWPTHITVVPWFKMLPEHQNPFFVELHRLTRSLHDFTYTIGPIEYFGPNKDIAVNVIPQQELLHGLHIEVMELLQKHGAVLEKNTYTLEDFRAHITRKPDTWVSEGKVQALHALTVFRLVDNNFCEKVEDFKLWGEAR